MIKDLLKLKISFWGCKIPLTSGAEIELQILSNQSPPDSSLIDLAESLVQEIDRQFETASEIVQSSVYKEDVEMEGGLNPSAAQIHSVSDVRIWFVLGNSNRQLGVNFRDGEYYDIYCESP